MENNYPSLVLYTGRLPGIDLEKLGENLLVVQNALFAEMGVISPLIRVEQDELLPDGTFQLKINENLQDAVAGLDIGEYWVLISREMYQTSWGEAVEGVVEGFSARDSFEPNNGAPAMIIRPGPLVELGLKNQNKDFEIVVREAGLEVRNQLDYIIFCVAAGLRRNLPELVTDGLTRYLLGKLELKNPALVQALMQALGPEKITQGLRDALRRGQSLLDLKLILENMLVEWAA
jgi:type III secretory pathway component EscV